MEAEINQVLARMQASLSSVQLQLLKKVLGDVLNTPTEIKDCDNARLLSLFLTAKEVEGCSAKTLAYYESTIKHMDLTVAKPYIQICSDDLRQKSPLAESWSFQN